MSFWNKIVIGAKFLFCGFESATDYALKLLNAYLRTQNIAANIQKARAYVEMVLGYMLKYKKFCPVGWVPHYEKLLVAIQTVSDTFADNQIDQGEIDRSTAAIQAAIEEWMKD